MTIEDDETLIENIQAKLTIAKQSVQRNLELLAQHIKREQLITIDPAGKQILIQHVSSAADAVLQNDQELADAMENAGTPEDRRHRARPLTDHERQMTKDQVIKACGEAILRSHGYAGGKPEDDPHLSDLASNIVAAFEALGVSTTKK
jgi:hypothetical protein